MKTEKDPIINPDKKIQTPETLAVNLEQDLKEGKAKLFSVAEMWNLRRNFRSASGMRKSWN
jgi:hypothetical protein